MVNCKFSASICYCLCIFVCNDVWLTLLALAFCTVSTLSCMLVMMGLELLRFASLLVIVVATLLKMFASAVSFSFSGYPMFDGVSFCRTHTSLFDAANIASTLVYIGIIIYWCLKYTVSATCMLIVCLIQVCTINNALSMFQDSIL